MSSAGLASVAYISISQPESRSAITCCLPFFLQDNYGKYFNQTRPPVSTCVRWLAIPLVWLHSLTWWGILTSQKDSCWIILAPGSLSDSWAAFARSINLKSTSCTRVWWRMSQSQLFIYSYYDIYSDDDQVIDNISIVCVSQQFSPFRKATFPRKVTFALFLSVISRLVNWALLCSITGA